jgi:hypothetical protein
MWWLTSLARALSVGGSTVVLDEQRVTAESSMYLSLHMGRIAVNLIPVAVVFRHEPRRV